MSAVDDVNTVIATLNTVVTELSNPVAESTADQVLAAIVPVLTAAGYTVTAPAAPEAETPAEDATDTSTEA